MYPTLLNTIDSPLKRRVFLVFILAFIVLFFPGSGAPPPAKETTPHYLALMRDTTRSITERLEAHSQLMRLAPWGSSYQLLAIDTVRAGDPFMEACFRSQRTEKFYTHNDTTISIELVGEDLRWLVQHDKVIDPETNYWPVHNLMSYYIAQSQIDSAIVLIERTYPSWHKYDEVAMHSSAVEVFTAQGDYSKALLFLKRGMTLARRADQQMNIADYYAKLADIMYSLKLNEEALFAYGQCSAKIEAAPLEQQKEYSGTYRYTKQIIIADTEEIALDLFNRLLDYIGPTYEQELKVDVYDALAKYYILRDLPERAIDPLTASIDLAQRYQLTLSALNKKVELTKILNTVGRARSAVNLGRSVEQQLRERLMRSDLLRVYEELTNGYEQLGLQDSSYHYNRIAATLTKEVVMTKRLPVEVANIMNASLREEENPIYAQETQLIQNELARQRLMLILTGSGLLVACGLIYLGWRLYALPQRNIRLLSAQKKKLEAANNRLDRFVGIISHDILSNLEMVLATGNVLVGPNGNKEQLRNYYNATQTISTKLHKYCINLLETAYTDTPETIVSAADSDNLVKELLLQYKSKLTQLNFRIETESLPPIALPPVVLQQFLHNGITNALKYAPREGNPAPLLKIGGHVDPEGKAYWHLEDDGPGILDTKKEAILFGEKALESRQGQGVGLKKLRDQIALYGGKLTISTGQWGGCKLIVSADDSRRN